MNKTYGAVSASGGNQLLRRASLGLMVASLLAFFGCAYEYKTREWPRVSERAQESSPRGSVSKAPTAPWPADLTLTPSLTPTPSETPHPSPTPTLDPVILLTPAGPFAVSFTRAYVEARALSYLSPEQEPRVEFSRLMSVGQMRMARPGSQGFGSYALDHPNDFLQRNLNEPIYAVVLSTAGMNLHSLQFLPSWTPAHNCNPVPPHQREAGLHVFSALTGERLFSESLTEDDRSNSFVNLLAELPQASSIHDPSSDRSASPVRLEPSVAQRHWNGTLAKHDVQTSQVMTRSFRLDNVHDPLGMRERDGRWWRYRVRSRSYGAFWRVSDISVQTNRRLQEWPQEDALFLDIEIRPVTTFSWNKQDYSERSGPWPFLLSFHNTDHDLRISKNESIGGYSPKPVPTQVGNWRLAEGFKTYGSQRAAWKYLETFQLDVATFSNCKVVKSVLSAGSAAFSVECSHLGPVLYERLTCYTPIQGIYSLELIDWWGADP